MRSASATSLTEALAVRPRELVALAGGGGKTFALQLLVWECAGGHGQQVSGASESGGQRVLATTTTGMFGAQLRATGPLVTSEDRHELSRSLQLQLAGGGTVSAARAVHPDDKVNGLLPEWVDCLWAGSIAEQIFVEADGSRGLSLKAFAAHEPPVPEATTLIVLMAGLDVLGAPLDDAHVHRAGLLAERLGVSLAAGLTCKSVESSVRDQMRALRERWPAARISVLLNKAEDDPTRKAGASLAKRLLGGGGPGGAPLPEAVVVGSVLESRFVRFVPSGPLISVVVLAAGRSTRMGSQKLLLPVDGRPMIERVVHAACRSQAAEVVVVLASGAEAVRVGLAGQPGSRARLVDNPDYREGMAASLRVGAAAARPDRDGFLVVLGDQPFIDPGTIDRLIDRFARDPSKIVRPVVGGRPAHPVLMPAGLLPEILALQGDTGAREILTRHADQVELLTVSDARTCLDLDTPEDYADAVQD